MGVTGSCRSRALFITIFLASTRLLSQSTSGFSGTVAGPQGKAISGAAVTIRNTSTGSSRTTVTDDSGNFDAQLMPPGRYDITAGAPGFQTITKTGLELLSNHTARADFTLQIRTIQESVTVQADTTPVDALDSATRAVVNERSIVDLPLNGRSFRDL